MLIFLEVSDDTLSGQFLAQSTPSLWLGRPLPNIEKLLFGCLHALYAHSLYVAFSGQFFLLSVVLPCYTLITHKYKRISG